MFFTPLETGRLYLRNLSEKDRKFLFSEFSDDAVNRYLYDAEPYKRLEDADELIAFYCAPEPRDRHRWVLVRKEDGAKLGTCGFHGWDRTARRAEVGYEMPESYRGQGYMTEALGAAMQFAEHDMHLAALDACIYPANERSVRMARRFGFVYEGRDAALTFHGVTYVHHIYTRHFGRVERDD